MTYGGCRYAGVPHCCVWEGSVAEVFATRGVDAEHDEEEEGEAPQ